MVFRCRMPIIPYDTKSQIRNAKFISIARRAIHHPQRRRRCRPLSEAMQPFYTTRGVSRAPFFIIRGEAAIHNPQRPKAAVKPKNPTAVGRSILRTFFLPPERKRTQPAAGRRPQPSAQRAVNPHARRACPRAKLRQPSRRRRVPIRLHGNRRPGRRGA